MRKLARVIPIGVSFLAICAFWQVYDTLVPLMLKNTFRFSDSAAGWILALGNIPALFLLPWFGALSDRTTCRIGRRRPFILAGSVAAGALLPLLAASEHAGDALGFFLTLGALLIAMSAFRSPTLSLMTDVTPRESHTQANALMNLMGASGGVYALWMIGLLARPAADGRVDARAAFASVSAVLVLGAALVTLLVREGAGRAGGAETPSGGAEHVPAEPPSAASAPDESPSAASAPTDLSSAASATAAPTPVPPLLASGKPYRVLFAIFFWYLGFTGMSQMLSRYVQTALGGGIQSASSLMMAATASAVVCYLPAGSVSARLGRRKCVYCGLALLAASFAGIACFDTVTPLLYLPFVLMGPAWALVNVNGYPMVVGQVGQDSVGRFTGLYYTFISAAQIAAPILCGYLVQWLGYPALFPCCAAACCAAMGVLGRGGANSHKP